MPEIQAFSLKVGTSHGLWQYKHRGTHDRIMMHGLRDVLNKTCQLLGYDSTDRSAICLFYFSAQPFPGYQVNLEKVREKLDGCYYRVKGSNIGPFKAVGLFPVIVNSDYLHSWPAGIYVKLERSPAGGIVNSSETDPAA
jgi:hypothetical protein